MGYYLLDHPNTRIQYGVTRRNGAVPSGTTVIHTAENVTDTDGPDYGAESVASWITLRTDPGSYHVLCDADSTVLMAPWSYETWNDTQTNNWNVGISGAIRSADWPSLGLRGDQIVIRMALAAREYAAWLKSTRGIVIPARHITRAEALARVPGFIGHGEIDIGRRTDPGAAFNWTLFLTEYARLTAQENDMPQTLIIAWQADGAQFVGDGITRRWLPSQDARNDLDYQAAQAGITVRVVGRVDNIAWLGTDVSARPTVDTAALAAAIVKALPAGTTLTAAQVAAEFARRLAT